MRLLFTTILIGLLQITSIGQSVRKVDINQLLALTKGKDTTYVINFWATFCAPCVAEMPDLLRIKNNYKNKAVVFYFVSLDFEENFPKEIATFIKKKKWRGNYCWLNETNADYFCPKIDVAWSGVIPATLVINSNGFRQFWGDPITASKLEAAIETSLVQ